LGPSTLQSGSPNHGEVALGCKKKTFTGSNWGKGVGPPHAFKTENLRLLRYQKKKPEEKKRTKLKWWVLGYIFKDGEETDSKSHLHSGIKS